MSDIQTGAFESFVELTEKQNLRLMYNTIQCMYQQDKNGSGLLRFLQ